MTHLDRWIQHIIDHKASAAIHTILIIAYTTATVAIIIGAATSPVRH